MSTQDEMCWNALRSQDRNGRDFGLNMTSLCCYTRLNFSPAFSTEIYHKTLHQDHNHQGITYLEYTGRYSTPNRVEDHEVFIDIYYYYHPAMENDCLFRHTPNSNKRKNKDSATVKDNLKTTDIQVSVFKSINKKLDILNTLHQEIKDLRSSLQFTNSLIVALQTDNRQIHTTVKLLTSQISTIQIDNKTM